MPKASDNPYPSALFVEGTTPATPSSGDQRLFVRSSDHVLCMVDSTGTVTPIGSGGGGLVSSALASKTSGNTTLTSTSEGSVDTGLDLTLAAIAGDLCEVWINCLVGNENVIGNFDVATIVSSSPVHYFGAGLASSAQGLLGWSKQNAGGSYQAVQGSAHLVLASGDISGGNVVLRLRYKVGGNLTLFSSANTAFLWGAKVLR